MAVVYDEYGQGVSTAFPEYYVSRGYTKRRSRGGGGGGMSTITTPTPSASWLYGSSAQREAQIRLYQEAYRYGGSTYAEQQLFKQTSQIKAAEIAAERNRKLQEKQTQQETLQKQQQETSSQGAGVLSAQTEGARLRGSAQQQMFGAGSQQERMDILTNLRKDIADIRGRQEPVLIGTPGGLYYSSGGQGYNVTGFKNDVLTLEPSVAPVSNIMPKEIGVESFSIQDSISKGFGGVAITAADTSYKSYISGRNPFTGTVSYIAEKTRGKLSKREETRMGQNPFAGVTGERVSIGVQIAPFFIPATAPFFLVGTAVGSVTPGGLAESKAVGKQIEEQTKIPSGLVSTAYTGTQLVGGAIGAKMFIGQAGRIAGFPKYEVKVITKPTSMIDYGEGTVELGTTSYGVVTQKNLIGSRQAMFATQEATRVTKQTGDLLEFQQVSRGVSRTYKGIELPTGKMKFSSPRPFGSQASGIARQGTNVITMDVSKGISQSAEVEGANIAASIRTKLFRPNKDFTETMLLGKSYELPSGTVTSSQFAPIKRTGFETTLGKTGRGTIFGFKPAEKTVDISTRSGSLVLSKSQRPSQIMKEVTKTSVIQGTFPTVKSSPVVPGVSSATKVVETQTPTTIQSPYYGTGQYERTDFVQTPSPSQMPTQTLIQTGSATQTLSDRQDQISFSGLAQPTVEIQRQKFAPRLASPVSSASTQVPVSATTFAQVTGQESALRQKTITSSGSTFGTPLPVPPQIFFPSIPPILPKKPNFEDFAGLGPIKGGKRRLKYTPDFRSLILGIRGKAPKLPKEGYTGLEQRPIPKGFSWFYSKPKKKQQVFSKAKSMPKTVKKKRKKRR